MTRISRILRSSFNSNLITKISPYIPDGIHCPVRSRNCPFSCFKCNLNTQSIARFLNMSSAILIDVIWQKKNEIRNHSWPVNMEKDLSNLMMITALADGLAPLVAGILGAQWLPSLVQIPYVCVLGGHLKNGVYVSIFTIWQNIQSNCR